MKKSSIDYFIWQVEKDLKGKMSEKNWNAICFIAKEMHEQEIIDACYHGSQNLPYEIKDKSKQYYNKTFKQ